MRDNDDILYKIIVDVESFTPQLIKKAIKIETFEVRSYKWLLSNLRGGIGTLFIRNLFYWLNLNEHHVFRWRLDNKYIQYLIFDHYNPDCMPETLSLSNILSSKNGVQKIKTHLKNGYFIKATLGHSSGKDNSFDKTAELDHIISVEKSLDSACINEKWILQKKLTLRNEFRIHTFNKEIISGLTFEVHAMDSFDSYLNAEIYLKDILEKLPDSILQGSLIGWDIGITDTGNYFIIEANFSGFHPEFNYGFQTSGYFQDITYGPIVCAWLNNYLKAKYQICLTLVEDVLVNKYQFFKDMRYYLPVFNAAHLQVFEERIQNCLFSSITIIDSTTNDYLVRLIQYLLKVNFVGLYFIITAEDQLNNMIKIFRRYDRIKVLSDNMLFTKSSFELVKKLSISSRKNICYLQMFKVVEQKSCVIVQ